MGFKIYSIIRLHLVVLIILSLHGVIYSQHLNGIKFGIDPGHGGSEPGAVGPNGLEEADVNLVYALKMRDYLQQDGAEVAMTRTTDVYLSLASRSSYINAQGCDYSFSCHNNASGDPSPDYTGVHVYLSAGSSTSGDIAYDQVHRLEEHLHIGFVSSNCGREGVHEDNFHMVREVTMPATLIEGAFISNYNEEFRMRDDRYMKLFGWACYAGFCDYAGVTIPNAPTHFKVLNNGDGSLNLSWNPVAGATGYKTYRSTDGENFTVDSALTGISYNRTGLAIGSTYFFYVAAIIQSGGYRSQGYQTHVAGAIPTLQPKSGIVLIVDGYQRQESDLGNIRNFVVPQGKAIDAAGFPFETVSDELINESAFDLSPYGAIDWLLGEESSLDSTITPNAQTLLASYLDLGGNLFISGAEIGWDLEYLGTTADQDFLHNYLKTDYYADDAGVYRASGTADSIFDGMSNMLFNDEQHGVGDIDYPDCYLTSGGSSICMTYDGTSYNAAVIYDGTYKLVHLGFPFEALFYESDRNDVMEAVLTFFDIGSGTPSEIIILESRDPTGAVTPSPPYYESGSWSNSTAKSTAPGLVGDGSRFSYTTELEAVAAFIPYFTIAGYYNVYVTWGNSANAIDVKHSINHWRGTTDTLLLQDGWGGMGPSNAHQWLYLGNFLFNVGRDSIYGSITIDERTVTGTPSEINPQRAYVDAVKFELTAPVTIPENALQKPENMLLVSAYPNPFNSKVYFSISSVGIEPLHLEIYDITGKLVSVVGEDGPGYPNQSNGLVSGVSRKNSPVYRITWSPDAFTPSGVYLYKLTVGETQKTGKVMLLK